MSTAVQDVYTKHLHQLYQTQNQLVNIALKHVLEVKFSSIALSFFLFLIYQTRKLRLAALLNHC